MYACIDLGSNSFHLLIAHCHDGSHDVVERFSEKGQLGEGIAATSMIAQDAFVRGLKCLKTFRQALDRYPITHCWAVGTNALRVAQNATAFLDAASQLGIDVDVVSGLDEAALVYAGVNSALPVIDRARLIIDVGGGSTEIIVGQGEMHLQAHSMPIGCVSWRDKWFPNSLSSEADVNSRLDDALTNAEEIFAGVAGQLQQTPWCEVFASSGTAKMLSLVCSSRVGGRTSGISLVDLHQLRPDIIRVATDPGFVLPGLKSGRRELILPGWAVLCGFMHATGVTEINFSPAALREGMLHYMMSASKTGDSPLHVLKAR